MRFQVILRDFKGLYGILRDLKGFKGILWHLKVFLRNSREYKGFLGI